MRIFMYGFLLAALVFSALVGVGWLVTGSTFEMYSVFAPKYESVRRDVMLNSRAYSEATTREMYRLKLQYSQAKTQEEKDTIKAFALHESEAFDKDRLPLDLQVFINSLSD